MLWRSSQDVAELFTSTISQIETVMMPEGDPQVRQELFNRWVGDLILPAVPQATGLELNRLVHNDRTELLLIESPEPLALSGDVSMVLNKQTFQLPLTEKIQVLPLIIEKSEVQIELVDTRFTNNPEKLSQLIKSFDGLKWLVKLEANEETNAYFIYAMELPIVEADKITIPGKLDQVIRVGDGKMTEPPAWFEIVQEMDVDELALVSGEGELLFDTYSALEFTPVSIRVLTNGSETRAIIIPVAENGSSPTVAPLGRGSYRIEFDIRQTADKALGGDQEEAAQIQASLKTQW